MLVLVLVLLPLPLTGLASITVGYRRSARRGFCDAVHTLSPRSRERGRGTTLMPHDTLPRPTRGGGARSGWHEILPYLAQRFVPCPMPQASPSLPQTRPWPVSPFSLQMAILPPPGRAARSAGVRHAGLTPPVGLGEYRAHLRLTWYLCSPTRAYICIEAPWKPGMCAWQLIC